jgi:hypothetical protein
MPQEFELTALSMRLARAPEPMVGPKRLRLQNRPAEHDGKITLIPRGASFNATAEGIENVSGAHSSVQQGFKGTLDRLAGHLANPS